MRDARKSGGRARWVAWTVAAVVVAAGAAAAALLLSGRGSGPLDPAQSRLADGSDRPPGRRPSILDRDIRAFEPLAFDAGSEGDLLQRGGDAFAHVVYAKSPGGVEAAAARTTGWRDRIDAAARRRDVDPDTLAALVFLESGGRPDVIAGGDPEGAVGLAQILPGTATDLLGMHVDLARSRSLTRRIDRDRRRTLTARTVRRRRAAARRVPELVRERRQVDDRFSPRLALDGAALYLAKAERRFGRADLATASYHMGIGNLEQVIDDYIRPRRPRRYTRNTVERFDISYPRLFYDSSPIRHRRAFRRLFELGDDSRSYLFRIEAARDILALHDDDRQELLRLQGLQLAKGSAEEVLRPESDNEPYADADALASAYEAGDLVHVPNEPRRLGYRVDRRMGSMARTLKTRPDLYRGLRPEALGSLLYIAKETRRMGGEGRALLLTSTVRDRPYQRGLIRTNPEATHAYSLHTTGYAFDLALDSTLTEGRRRALVDVLERLRALRLIDWVYEPTAVHITVGPDGDRMLPLYERLVAGPG